MKHTELKEESTGVLGRPRCIEADFRRGYCGSATAVSKYSGAGITMESFPTNTRRGCSVPGLAG